MTDREFADPMRTPVLGHQEIAVLLDVKHRTVTMWKYRDVLPEPDFRLRIGDLWLRSTIERWAKHTGRWPHDNEPPELHLPPGWIPPEGFPPTQEVGDADV